MGGVPVSWINIGEGKKARGCGRPKTWYVFCLLIKKIWRYVWRDRSGSGSVGIRD